MTNWQFNVALVALIAAVTLATYMVTKALTPSPLPLAVSLMSLTPEQLDTLDKQAAELQAEGKRLSAEVNAAIECSRAAKTPEAWKACAETR